MSFNHAIQNIVRFGSRSGENGPDIELLTGITGNLYTSGLAVDEITGEIFIIRANYKTPGNTPAWVDIYDRHFTHQKTISIGFDFPEGAVIGYINGVRKIAIGMSTGYGVYTLPVTETLVNLATLSPDFVQPATEHTGQMSAYGEYVVICNSEMSSTTQFVRGLYSVFHISDFLTQTNPQRISFLTIPTMIAGTAFGDSMLKPTKAQSIALTPFGVTSVGGQVYRTSNVDGSAVHSAKRLRYADVSFTGELLADAVFHPGKVLTKFTEMGYRRPNGLELDFLEAEGAVYSNVHGLLSVYAMADMEAVVRSGAGCSDTGSILDLRDAIIPQTAALGIYRSVDFAKPISPDNGEIFNDIDDVCDYMKSYGIRHYTFNVGNKEINIGQYSHGLNSYVRVTNADDSFFQVEVWDMHAGDSNLTYVASQIAPRAWVRKPMIVGGVPLSSSGANTVQIAPGRFPQIRVINPAVTNNTSMAFFNGNGLVGSISNTATSTAFNTTSDERLKNQHGEIKGALNIISELITTGAVQNAAFTSQPDTVYPMFMAQKTQKIVPQMVTEGSDDNSPGEEGFIPWAVDMSIITPWLVAAIYELNEKIKKWENGSISG